MLESLDFDLTLLAAYGTIRDERWRIMKLDESRHNFSVWYSGTVHIQG